MNQYDISSNKHQRIYDKMLEDDHESPRENPFDVDPNASIQQSPEQTTKVEMVIEFGHNASASLLVGPDDDPTTLAKKFCFKNNIDPHVINTLASNIRSLQNSSFSLGGGFKVQRNCDKFDDKENCSTENIMNRSRGRSIEKNVSNSKMKVSRNKTNQSFHNQSMRTSTGPRPSGYNVFDRLYQDSRKKKTSRTNLMAATRRGQSSRVSMASQNKSMNESSIYGCLHIYEKNTKKKQQSFTHNKNLYQSKVQKQLEDCSFQPQINPLSNLIATKLRQLDESSILNRTGNNKTMMKIKQYLLKKEQEEMKQCTFQPRIINKIAMNSTQRYDRLYEDHQHRQNKKKIMMSTVDTEEQYQPKINKVSRVIVKGNFFQRLEQDKGKRISKQQSREKLMKSNEKRKPSIGRAPTNRNLGDKTVGQYLYEKSKASRALSTKQQPQVHTDMRSSQIYAKSKQIAVQYIFELLDNNQDGLISSTKINISALSEDVLRLLAPLLAEMEEVDVELNFQEFNIAFERLYSTFSVDEKNIIIKSYKNKQINSNVSQRSSFNPTLNEQSLRIARQLCSDDVDIYQASLVRLRQKENKLNRLRAERVLEEYSQCTFHPNIHR